MNHLAKTHCDRCGTAFGTHAHGMSWFNTDMICGQCREKEQAHPQYAEAKRIELEHTMRGDYKFPGIGKPEDL